ncbi:hypothetical protein TRL7639_03302 [Falsiruegeria litorea R37]|uniref:Uncharacterized protein n=1 Tax=Falsiruegeria litorea R37 TaxID=1200284 RepID=A0A1Y5TEB9_9RHOB|nr:MULTISPECIES: hypothetical protein [Roseobacteraceae]MBO9450694.1 hypothetical protein [Tropicibacter sp. R16_0]SLN60011.1 hypothetical protein TRL7639_03302 [Falsiruegeria litorea R37]
MNKLIAIINVIAWSGFWAFGYLAVTAEGLTESQLVIAALLAFGGLVTGIAAYMRLVRASEASGYARKSNQLDAAARNRAQSEGGI